MSLVPIVSLLAVAIVLLMAGCQTGPAPAERTDAVSLRGKPLTLLGPQLKVDDLAPDFSAVANDMATYRFSNRSGAVWVLASVPSLDTPVCSIETRRFNEEASKLSGVKILTISMDLPFAQARWCGAEGVKNVQTLSDSRDRAFGTAYGLRIKENGLLARAVFVINKTGRIAYVQIVPELSQEPDYDSALAAARKAAGE